MPATDPRRSVLTLTALLMAAIVLLALAGMLSSILIAHVTDGLATAVNQSGTLRMQSYRIGAAIADERAPLPERQQRVAMLMTEFEARFDSSRLTAVIPASRGDPVRRAYEGVRWRWVHELRGPLTEFITAADADGRAAAARTAYLAQVDLFVAAIHDLVRLLEEAAEARIDLLQLTQAVGLGLIVLLVAATLVLLRRRVVIPLGALLDCADRTRRGDFSGRTAITGGDELGRLGAAMNLMTAGLQQLYAELEARIAEKTADLARSNRSLELLYDTSRRLDAAPLSPAVLRDVLTVVQDRLGLAGIALCLRDGVGGSPCVATVAGAGTVGLRVGDGRGGERARGRGRDGDHEHDNDNDDRGDGDGRGGATTPCALCSGPPVGGLVHQPTGLISLRVGDSEEEFGQLRVREPADTPLPDWQRPLLSAVAGHLTVALKLQQQWREGRRLVLHEERGILARELHDSLAQALSYLKIQAARLDAALRREPAAAGGPAPAEAAAILADMRLGINSAYRQLRELLTTFRLRIDGPGLGTALTDTVAEFAARGGVTIHLDDRLPPGLLSPNEEVHVLQIVREALSNVLRHADARQATVVLAGDDREVTVSVGDDGRGFNPAAGQRGHYGLTIMRERAASLGGTLDIDAAPGTGTRVRLRFLSRLGAEGP